MSEKDRFLREFDAREIVPSPNHDGYFCQKGNESVIFPMSFVENERRNLVDASEEVLCLAWKKQQVRVGSALPPWCKWPSRFDIEKAKAELGYV